MQKKLRGGGEMTPTEIFDILTENGEKVKDIFQNAGEWSEDFYIAGGKISES